MILYQIALHIVHHLPMYVHFNIHNNRVFLKKGSMIYLFLFFCFIFLGESFVLQVSKELKLKAETSQSHNLHNLLNRLLGRKCFKRCCLTDWLRTPLRQQGLSYLLNSFSFYSLSHSLIFHSSFIFPISLFS
jgi:hypothetical protein